MFLIKTAYNYYKQGYNIYSNVHLNFPYTPIDYNDIVNCKYNNGIVILDEIHLLLPSRNSMSKVNRAICDGFLSMVRKKNLEVYGTTQTLRKVDVRFREEQDYIYVCNKWVFLNKAWMEAPHNRNFDKEIPIMVSLKVIEDFSQNQINISFIGNDYFDMYDSSQIIDINGVEA